MNKIYQCEDSIEQVKFLLASLKIQSAFLTVHNLVLKKSNNYQQTFLFLLKVNNNRNLLKRCEKGFDHFASLVQDLQEKRKRKAFYTILTASEKQERKSLTKNSRQRSDHLRKSMNTSQFGNDKPIMSVSVIEEENWKEKMTLEELQASCEYYNMKIKEVQKSFSEFFHVIKKQ